MKQGEDTREVAPLEVISLIDGDLSQDSQGLTLRQDSQDMITSNLEQRIMINHDQHGHRTETLLWTFPLYRLLV